MAGKQRGPLPENAEAGCACAVAAEPLFRKNCAETRDEMKSDDAAVLREVQKNAEMGRKAIETILPKIQEGAFSYWLNGQELGYSQIRDRAKEELLRGHAEGYYPSAISEMMLKGGIHANTLLNTSISHGAQMMIQGGSRGIADIWKTLNRHVDAGESSMQLAEELLNFEQKSIEELKKYL